MGGNGFAGVVGLVFSPVPGDAFFDEGADGFSYGAGLGGCFKEALLRFADVFRYANFKMQTFYAFFACMVGGGDGDALQCKPVGFGFVDDHAHHAGGHAGSQHFAGAGEDA